MMTRTELAESMAEFLGPEGRHAYGLELYGPKLFIFSPGGFFAVWDKVDELYPGRMVQFFFNPSKQYNLGPYFSKINKFGGDPSIKHIHGKDRYTAFYSAVHEMRQSTSSAP